jgi:hypothetical protein
LRRAVAIPRRSASSSVCTSLAERERRTTRVGRSCLSARLLSETLARRPFHAFGGGGGLEYTFRVGFARAEVVTMAVRTPAPSRVVVLSEPWRPQPWRGRPIRFFYALAEVPPGADPGDPSLGRGLRLTARLQNGQMEIEPAPGRE